MGGGGPRVRTGTAGFVGVVWRDVLGAEVILPQSLAGRWWPIVGLCLWG